MALTNRRRFPVLLILIAALALFLAGAPVQAQEGSAPDAPTGLIVASVSHDSVELDWDDSGDSSITHYQVFRRDRALHDAGEFVIIEEDTGSTATEYTDAAVEADEEYVYRVKAVNAYGASPWSDHVRADTPTGPGQGAVYTYEDGDRTIRVILQGDLVVQETGADTPSDDVVRRTAGGNIVRKQSGQGGADLPVFRSASGGALMTLPGGVLLALDPDWDEAMVNGFFARNNIAKARISELDYIPNGFFVRTEPGFPSLELANALAAEKGVLVSSPNWWREVEAKQGPEETKGDDQEGTQKAGGIEPRNENIGEAYDLPLDGSYRGFINPAGDVDYFKLDLSDQDETIGVRIYTTDYTSASVGNKIVDTVGNLYSDSDSDSDGYLDNLGSNNDNYGTRHFSILASLSPGVYYVTVRGSSATDIGGYRLHAETVTATNVSLGSSVAATIGGAGEVDFFKLDLSGQTGTTDVSLFTVSDNLQLLIGEAEFSGLSVLLRNTDASGDTKWIRHVGDVSVSPGSYRFAVWSPDGDTGGYSLRAAAVPDHGGTTATATTLSLDAPTSGKLTSASDADYFKLVLTDAKDLAIMAFSDVNAVMLNSDGTEIPVNMEIGAGGSNRIIDDFAPGTYYVKITAPDASSSTPVYYALYAYEDTGYGTWVDGCTDATNDLGISTIDDPLYACQWHLSSDDSADMDINVESVWADSITGAGINVVVVDYTIDFSHADLSPNINSSLNHDYGARSNAYRPAEHHGTNVAGVIAALDNAIGVRGVAPRATIYGYNLLADGEIYATDMNEADAMLRNRVVTAVSNNSWGPVDGYAFDHAPEVWEMAIDKGVKEGYGGKGVFYAWAGGNGGKPGVGRARGDNSNFDEYANYYGVTAVCAVGDDGIRSSYSEKGANLWVCAPSTGGDLGIVTTENSDRYINTFGGTSSATPKVAGVAALLRHANPDLTWRDLKLILAASARQNHASNAGWKQGARKYGSTDDSDRYHFNHEYGFGVVDAAAAVALARDWRNLPEFKNASSASRTLNRTIPDNTASGITSSLSLDTEIDFTEFVEVTVTIDHPFWRDLRIELVSPAGSVSTLAVPAVFIDIPVRPPESTVSPGTFRFGSAKHLGENPNGTWTLRVTDELPSDQGTLTSWSIKVYGHDNPVSAVSTGWTTATATVELHNPDSESLTAHLRYSGDDGTTWSTPAMQTTTGTSVDFDLTGLAPNAKYVLEASLDSTFEERSGFTADFVNRPANQDIDNLVAAGNTFPYGLWSNGTTIWVVDVGQEVGEEKIYAYTLATGARDSDKDIDTLTAAGNTRPIGLWSDGTTIWVVELGQEVGEEKIYAYTLATGVRESDKDIDTLYAAGNTIPLGLWSNGTTIWVVNAVRGTSGKLYAYTLATGARDSDKDIDTLTAAGNLHASGLWSDDTTIWVADFGDDKIYAYTLATGARDSDKDIDTLTAAGITAPVGLWSDDATIWVADQVNDKLYAYYIEVSARTPLNNPDLVVDAPTASPSSPTAGASFTLRATVRNQGGSEAAASTLRYYRSSNATIDTNDSSVGTDTVSSLSAGASSAQSIRLTAPATTGTYYYGACVGTVSGESDTANNCSAAVTVTVTAPDLVVESPSVSDGRPLTGASFTLRATVLNQGSAAAGSTTLRYYRSTDATIDTNDSSVGTDPVSGLAAAGTSAESIDLTAPSTAGTYYYGACVSTVTNESATGNNCSTAVRVTVVGRPDLVVESPSVSDSSLLTGAFFTLRATVRNQGGSEAAGTTLTYYRSTDSTISSSDTLVGRDAVSSLSAGADSPESIPLTAPTTAGTYYYGACVDAVTNESARTNNCSTAVRVTVIGRPDLVVDTPTVSDSSLLTGASFTLGATVRNQGGSEAAASTLRYYRSSNATIDTNDSSVGTDTVSGLSAGSNSPESFSVSAPTSAGTYYYGACVDAVTNESATGNNCSTGVRVTVVGPPDLVVESPSVSDSSPLTGASFTLRATVRNQGGAAAGSTTLRYYRSTDSTISSSDTPAGTDSVSSLGAGASSAQSIRLTAPATTGTYYYGACVGTVSGESATTNNCSTAVTVTVTAPDLVVVTPTVSAGSPLTGASFTLSATVRNQGTGAAGSTTLRYYRSTDSTISSSDTPAGTDSVSSLDAGNTSAESISLAAPTSAGTYYYGACVGTVTNESDTTNNCSTGVRVTVVAPPDLVVGTPRVSNSNPAAGTALTLSATVRNQGGSTAAGTTLTYYRSTNATIATNDTSVGTDALSSLGAGASSAQSTSVTAPSTAGTYYYGACVGTVTNESATTNNCSVAVAVTVGAAPAPDLVVEAPTVSDSSPLTGASFTLRATVRNLGSGAAGSTTLRYYRSSDATISTSDTPETSTAAVGVLGAGASIIQLIPLTAPATTGTYYYGACVDALTNESDTTNNCSAAVRVTVGAAPVFSEGAGTERSVAENSTAGTDVGSAVTATDADNDTLTYSLEGTDAASFSIVSTRGQIQTSADLNHEAKSRYSVTVKADDGKGGTATIRVTISVTDVNEPPTVDGEAQLTIFENEDLIASYSASDPEGVASTFTWSVAGTDRADFNIDRNTGDLTFRNTPNYESPADSNRDNVYVFTVRATDEGGLSGSLEVTATVANVDEPPTITGSATPPDFPENGVRSVATYQATDPEGRTITWGLSGTDSDAFNINEGVLTFTNIPDFEKPTDSNRDNEYLVTVQARDEGGNPASLDVTVTVINSAGVEEPSITTSRPSLTLQENGTGTIFTFRARDPQGRPIRWSLTGDDASNFTISISGGALTFNNPPDFEDPADDNGDNVYELTVVVTDEQGLTDSFDFTVTVTNHHENREPAITTNPSSGLTYQKLNYQENRTSTVHTYRARNYGSGPIIWSLSGPDFDSFDISELGVLTFKSAPNHEEPRDSGGDNDYEIAVVASNSGGYSDRLNVVITVTDVNEGPEISRAGSAPGSVPENQDQLQVLARYTATDPEGGTVSRWRTSGSDGSDFVINEQGELRFRNTPDYERPADSNRDNVYVFTVQASDGRNYGSFEETVTVTPVNEPPAITTTSSSATALRQNENVTSRLYTYRATDPEGADTVTWSVEGVDKEFFAIDEGGQFSFKEENAPDYERPADSGRDNVYNVVVQATDDDNNTAPLPVTVTVRDVNEGPEVTSGSPSFTISENRDLPNAVYEGFDPEGGTVTRWTVGGTDGGDFTISQEGVLTFRNTPDFERPADSNRDNMYEVTVRPYDGRYYGSFEVTVTVLDVNEPPAITTTSNSATALRQNENVTSRLYTYRATDPEGADTVTWSVEGVDARFFDIDEGGQFSFKEENAPDFEQPADSGRDNVYNVEIQAEDSGGIEASLPVTVTVRDVNEGPEVTSGSPSFTISENRDLPNAVYTGFDPEGGTVTRWTVGGTDGGDFTISQEGVLTFRNTPDFERPADSNRDNMYEVTVRPYDGRYYGSFEVTVTVLDVNEPPAITTTSNSATALRQNENVTSRLYTYRATDPEGADTVTWSVEGVDARFFDIDEGGQFSFKEENAPDFEQPADSGRDNVYNVEIQAEDSGGIKASLPVTVTVENDAEGVEPTITTRRPPATYRENGTSAVYTFRASEPQRGPISWSLEGADSGDFIITGVGSGRAVLAFSSPPDYENPEDSDRGNDYELTVIATDEDSHVDRLSFTIIVTEVDEGPEVSGPSSFSINENESLPDAVYTARDPEGSNVARWSVGGRDGGDFFITQGGTLYFRSPPDYERPADSNRDNVYEVAIQPSDGRNNGSYPVTVTVTNVNEPPEIKSGSKTSFMQPENRTSRLHTYSAADPEGGTVTWAVVGPDAGLFTIDERGQFSFREETPPDFDNPGDVGKDNVYDVTIQARDPQSKTANLPVTVTVTEVNEGPVISRDGNLFGSPPGSVPENQSVTQVLATYTASDPERPGVQITQWSTTGRDGGDFVINALGQLMFRNPPDYERPADSNRDNVYEVEIRASDGRNTGTLEEVQRVTVTDVNEAPIITTTSRTAFTQPEDRTSTLYTFRATDPEGDDVSWGLSGTDSSAFTMSETGALSFTNPPDYEQPADSGGDNVYNVTVQASDGRNTGTLDVTVTVTDHNEGQEPTISTRRPPATYRENDTRTVYTFRATDPQRGTIITWTLEDTDREDFAITTDSSGRAVLAFRNSPDFESPADADRDNVYELTVVATDPDDNSDRVDFTITVTDHNEGVEPTISTRRPPATYRENDTRTVYTFRASDPQRGTTITWRLDGTDAEDFTLTADDSGRGVLTFNNPPDFENPIDADENNVYELAVVATDDDGNSDRVDFTIAVTDVNEGPVITLEGTETTTVSENTPDTKVLADFTARDPEDTTANIFRWSTAGRDGGDFVISDLGELRFRSSPDYERPADSDRNNVYEVTVRAYDGRVYGAHDVTVTVTPVNEAPVITTKSRTEFTLRENFTAVLYTYRATDQDEDDAVTWSVEGDDGGDFAIYNGILNFRLLPDLENPADEDEDNVYEITVVAEDRAGLRDTVDAVVTITDQSEGPVIAGTRAYTVEENYDIARVLGSYTATDAKDNRPVFPRWSLSGRDSGDFTINEDGELAFRNIPDYDRPADSNRDNVYEVTVRGHDSQAYGNLEVTVTVTPVNEHAPVVTGRETLSFRENTAVETRLHTYRATDGDRDTSFTWSLEGDDSDAFVIDQGGVLTFSAPPDYEDPADRGTDNVYQVTVVASDGAKRGTLDVTVTVTEQNEGPVVSGTPEFTVVENRHLPSSAVYTARDPEAVGGVATTIRWSVSGRDGGDFTIHRDTGVLAFRTPPDHERPADADRDNVYEVTVRAHDGRNYGDFQVTVTVEDVAEITGPAGISRTENFEGGLATYSPAGQGALDVKPSWRLTGADSGDFTIDRESGELTFRSIPDHERPADSNRDNVYNFTVQVSDGSYHGTLDVTVTVTAVNEPPAITGRDSLSFRENTPVTTRLHTYRATDPEGDGFTWHLVGLDAEDFTITTDSSGRGVLTFASPPNFDIPSGSGAHVNEYLVTVVASDGTNRGTLDVTVTVTDQNEGAVVTGDQTIAVRENQDPAVTLHTYLASDPEGQRITRWSLSGSDGGDFLISANGELTFRNTPDYDRPADSNRDNEYLVTVRAYDGRTYGNLDVTVTVSNVNEHDPVIRSGSRTSFTYREEGTAALYTYRATDGDKDDTITWTTEGPDRGDFTIDGDTGELTFREPPDYEDPQDSGANSEYNLTVVATDSGRLTDRLDVTVTVTAVDEGPEVSGVTTYTVPEGQELARATFTAQDPEDLDAAVTSWRLAGSDAGDFTITDTGGNSARLTFRNTPDYDRPADSNRDNEYLVTIRAYNGSTYGSLDVTVKVTDENEAEPVVTGRDTLSFRENTATTTRLHTYRATDTDRNTEIIWSVEGDDGDYFAIEEGVLTFSAPPDYEGPTDSDGDNVYQVRVVASDGSNEGTLAVTVTVTDVNEGPVIAVTSANTAITVKENHDEVLATYAATDPEDPAAAITRWSVTGRDGGDFSINQDGELTFRNPPDHERPADSGRDNVYEVTVRASDGRVYGAHDVTVTVEAVDEAPEFRSGSRDSFSYRENGTAALYTYRATDPEGDKEVTWSVTGRDGGQFTIDQDTGVLSFLNPPDYDDPTDDGRDNEYLVTVVATDQTGRATNLPVTVTVTDVNEGPVIAVTNTNTAITVDENHDQVLAIYTATDPEDPDLEITRWSVTGRDGGDFTINDGGELTFRNPPDHERPADSDRDSVYEVTVRASDGRYYGTLNVTVTVRAVDEAPEFQRNTQDSFVYPENGASAIYTYRATDPEGSDVTWDLSGTDSDAFSIDKTGVLTFKSPPDYENPADTDDDNVYELTVEARDDSNTTPLDVTVTVTNLTDARVVIRGTAQVGRTLTAETSGIPDEDRRDKVDLSYQWLADETGVEGATDPTYEITERDEGKAIKVRVTFTDNAGKEETLTSDATEPVKPAQSNEPATGLPAIDGTAQVGETLTADASGISDADGMTDAVFRYQWTRWDSDTDEHIEGATDSTYEVSDEDEGKTIRLRVSFSDDRGNDEALTSSATGAVAARPAQLTATFPASPFQSSRHKGDDDRPQVIVAFNLPVQSFDKTTPSVSLTGATVSSLVRHEEDGLENAWVFFLDPEGNDDVVFTLVAGQSCDGGGICTGEGKMLSEGGTITLPGPDEEDKPDNTDSNEPNSPATGVPTIGGTAQVGEALTANTSGVADADGLSSVQYEHQWLADDSDISGATNSTYTLAAADEGKAIKVEVTFTDDAGNDESLTSAATDAVAAAPTPNNPATGAPTISGTAQVGETLTADKSGIADADDLTSATYSYQWLADDAEIAGANGSTYTLVAEDEGKAIKVQVSFTDDAGNNEALTSAATGAVSAAQPTEPPAMPTGLSATASLDSVTLTWDDPGDDSITGYVILRRVRENDVGGDFSELVADTGTAATTYTDDTVAAGTTYTYRIKAINGAGTSERSRWFHIDTPAAPVPDKPTGLSATASHDVITLTWEDPGDDSITGYVILRRLRYDDPSGHFDELVADTGTAAITYTDDTVKANTHYTYRIKAINEHGGVSERSRWFHIHTPACTLNTGDIWCGVVTVAAIEHNNATVAYGFLDDTNIGAGDLDGEPGDETFSVGTNGYTIVGIFVGSAGSINGVLHFYLDDDLSATDKAELELHVDGASAPFAFSDAAKLSGTDGSNNWSMSGLDWSSETTVTVRLRPATTE